MTAPHNISNAELTATHQFINPSALAPARGFSHVVIPSSGRTVYLAGQIATDSDGKVIGDNFAEQYDLALANVATCVRAAGSEPRHIVSMVIYTTEMQQYRDSMSDVGAAHRKHMGYHFPAMALLGVSSLVEPKAVVEIIATAVIPDQQT